MATKKPAPIDLPHLFAVSMELANTVEYGDATLILIAKAAKIPVARLRAEFVDFTHYLIALQQQLLDDLRDQIIATSSHYPPGLDRVRSASVVFLDQCLKHRGLRGWLLHARKEKPPLAEGLRRQNHSFALVISTEFHAMGWPYPLPAARLYLAAIQETARLEQAKGEPIAYIREALIDIGRVYAGASRKNS